jgi:hypothetical protein
MIRIANAQLWVHDQDEALAFYTKQVGLEVRTDVTVGEMGDFRWLTVGLPGQPDVAIVLMAIPGPPLMDATTADQVRELAAKGLRRHRVPDDGELSSYEDLKPAASSSWKRRSSARTASTRPFVIHRATTSA